MAQSRRIKRLVSVINSWSRSWRISLATFCTITITMVMGYIVRVAFFDSPESNFTPYWIGISAVGLIAYGLGWLWLVGFDWDDDRPWRASPASVYFLIAGGMSFATIVLGLMAGLVFGFVI